MYKTQPAIADSVRPSLVLAIALAGISVAPALHSSAAAAAVLLAGGLPAALALTRRIRRQPLPAAAQRLTASAIAAMAVLCIAVAIPGPALFVSIAQLCAVLACLGLHQAWCAGGDRGQADELRQLRALMEFTPDALFLVEHDGAIVTLNARAEEVLGLARLAVRGTRATTFLPGLQAYLAQLDGADGAAAAPVRCELVCQPADRPPFPVQVSLGRMGGDRRVLAIMRDLSERCNLEAVLLDNVTHDELTGLPNRALFITLLQQSIAAARSSGARLAVILLDIDHFKRINNTFGRDGGDQVLRETMRRLGRELAQGAAMARQGSDEFVVVQQDAGDAMALTGLAERLLARMRAPFRVGEHEIYLSASLGISAMASGASSADTLLHNVDMAINSAKDSGGDCYRFHSAAMDQGLHERMALENDLRHAVRNQELVVHYQPRVDFGSGAVVGMEALVRWQHRQRGMISPAQFIPLAEESGLIGEIGLWVLRTACTDALAWQAAGQAARCLSVNLSARQFLQPDLVQQVQQVLDDTGLAPACLELEITEGTVMHDTGHAIETLRALKQLGVGLSIDDFGTGYSSLSYLKLFPIDILKIDRSFVTDVIDDPDDAAITRAIVALAHSLELGVVAEGVENLEQALFLQACGCHQMQGYYFSRPVTAAQLTRALREPPQRPAGAQRA